MASIAMARSRKAESDTNHKRVVPIVRVAGHHGVEELRELTRREPDGRVRDRLRVVALAHEGRTAPQVAEALGHRRRSVQEWVLRYNAGGAAGPQGSRAQAEAD